MHTRLDKCVLAFRRSETADQVHGEGGGRGYGVKGGELTKSVFHVVFFAPLTRMRRRGKLERLSRAGSLGSTIAFKHTVPLFKIDILPFGGKHSIGAKQLDFKFTTIAA
jgi:hypothetical protein